MEINKKIKLLDFKLKKDLWTMLFWAYKSIFSWNWIDFLEHREYLPWDPVKNIDWKTVWKTDKIYSKVFEEDRDLNVLFILDLSWNIDLGFFSKTKKDLLEEVFYYLSMSCNYSWDNIGVYLLWIEEKPIFISYKKWLTNIYKTIKYIEDNEKYLDIDFKKELINISKKNINKNLIFILSDNLSSNDNDWLKFLSQKNEVIYLWIFDYFENNLYQTNANISLWNKNDFINISLDDKKKILKYRELRNSKIIEFKTFLNKFSIDYLLLDTKKDIYKELYLFFSKLKK